MEPRRRNGLVIVERRPGEVLLRDANSDATYVLNDAAFAVFDLCDGAATPAEMRSRTC
jgi:hypothetical protein